MTSVRHKREPELNPRARSDIQRLEHEERMLLDLGEPAAAAKIAAMRTAITAAWEAHARVEAARERQRLRSERREPPQKSPPAANADEQERARALAAAYDYIRTLVAGWDADDAAVQAPK